MLLKTVRPRRPVDDAKFREILTLGHQFGTPDVSEVYSPPRVATLAEQFGMRPGFSLDRTVLDPLDNKPWNFDCPEKRRRAKDLLRTVKPKLLIGSPMCRPFSNLMNLNKHRMGPENGK